jgi:hypothetical protein
MGVGGCGYLSSLSISCITFASCALRKCAPSSASAANAATSLRMVQVVWIAQLIKNWLRVLFNTTQEEVTSCAVLCLEGTEVGGIRVYVEDYVGSSTSDFCIGVCPHIVKELVHMQEVSSVGALCCAAIADTAMRMVGSTARV